MVNGSWRSVVVPTFVAICAPELKILDPTDLKQFVAQKGLRYDTVFECVPRCFLSYMPCACRKR